MKKKVRQKNFESSWGQGDFRPKIDSCGINGKLGWIYLTAPNGVCFGGMVSKTLVKQLIKNS